MSLKEVAGKCAKHLLWLDNIPRYGRLYSWDSETLKVGKARWTWQPQGRWGFNLIDNLDLLDVVFPWREVNEVQDFYTED